MANEKMKERRTVAAGARILPHNDGAEQSVLACVFLDKAATFHIMEQLLPNDFYNEHHAEIYGAMRDIFAKGVPVDFVTLTEELEKRNVMESVGGMTYISSLTNVLPGAANYKHYTEIVKKHSLTRRLIAAAGRIADAAFNPLEALEDAEADVLSYAEKQIFDLGESLQKGALAHIKDGALDEAIERIDTIHRDKDSLRGIPTGFRDLDYITNGLQSSDLILIAARPSVGKTALGMNIIQNIALKAKKKAKDSGRESYSCAVFSLEMAAKQLVHRMLCSVSNVSMKDSLSGRLNKESFRELWIGRKSLAEAQIYIDDSSLITPVEILSKCRRLQREKGLDVVLIDYLQLMDSGGGRKNENRQTEVAEITRRLKIAAKELKVPIILLSQMSRDVEKRTNHKPQLSDLRESGAIEQDADIVMFLNRKYERDDMSKSELERNTIELILAKHRNGECGTVKLLWYGDRVSFGDFNENYAGDYVPPAEEDEGTGNR